MGVGLRNIVCTMTPMREKDQRVPRRIGRRQVLTTAAVTSAVLAVGGALVEAVQTWQALHPPRIRYDVFLAATATAASAQGLATTLRPEGPFTKEMMQTVSRNTGIVMLKLTDTRTILRSACLAQGQDGLYILTSLHRPFQGNAVGAVKTSAAVATVLFGRPRIDTSFTAIAASKCTFVSGGSKQIPQDVALIGVPQAPFSSLELPADGIPIREDFIPRTGDPVLYAGYPDEFRDPNLLRSLTQGSVTRITDTQRAQPSTWGFTGLAALGSSGGPVCALVNGHLTGVGVTTQSITYVEEVIASSIPFSKLRTALAV
jgi:hypothetical protein